MSLPNSATIGLVASANAMSPIDKAMIENTESADKLAAPEPLEWLSSVESMTPSYGAYLLAVIGQAFDFL